MESECEPEAGGRVFLYRCRTTTFVPLRLLTRLDAHCTRPASIHGVPHSITTIPFSSKLNQKVLYWYMLLTAYKFRHSIFSDFPFFILAFHSTLQFHCLINFLSVRMLKIYFRYKTVRQGNLTCNSDPQIPVRVTDTHHVSEFTYWVVLYFVN